MRRDRSGPRWRQLAGIGLLAIVLLSTSSLGAKEFRRGDAVTMDSGDGLVAIGIDNDVGLDALRFSRKGGVFATTALHRLAKGRNLRVLSLAPGTYEFERSDLLPGGANGLEVRFGRNNSLTFTVEAGKLNYPGDFRFALSALRRTGRGVQVYWDFARFDRALTTMAGLDTEFPGLRARYPWRNATPAADAFADFLAREAADLDLPKSLDAAELQGSVLRNRKADAAVSTLVKELFERPQVSLPRMNAQADLLAFVESVGDRNLISVTDLDSGQTIALLRGAQPVNDIAWVGNRQLAATLSVDRLAVLEVFTLPEHGLAEKEVIATTLPGTSWLVSALPGSGREMIVGHVINDATSHPFRVTVNGAKFDDSQLAPRHRLDGDLENVADFVTDRAGEIRAVLVRDDAGKKDAKDDKNTNVEKGSVLMVRAPGAHDWRRGRHFGESDGIRLLAIAADGRSVYALSDVDRQEVQLVRISLDAGEIVETLVAIPETDIEGAVMRPSDGALVGATYLRDGALQTRYLEPNDSELTERFARLLPQQQVLSLESSADGSRQLIAAASETNRGSYFLFDAHSHQLQKLLDVAPDLHAAKLFASATIKVPTPDGLTLDAFLTLPDLPDKRARVPLVVHAHGGPFGIADTHSFDPEVQFLANRGYAVLRVNYRGSGGGGRRLEEAGYKNWGRGIEDDIVRAIDAVLGKYPLDPQRIALFGASYGGYSTLMGLIRTPERFRCGVAIAAPTDLPLMFSASDWWSNEASNRKMRRIVGDPDTDAAAMQEVSPLYQYRKLTRPLLLIQGSDDRRVTFEQALRLQTLLAHAGHAPQWLPMPGMGHGPTTPADRVVVYAATDSFLASCLSSGN